MLDWKTDLPDILRWRDHPYRAFLPFGTMLRLVGLEPDRRIEWERAEVLPANWLASNRLFTVAEVLALLLIVRHDEETGKAHRVRGFADALISSIEIAASKSIDPKLLALACVHAVLRDADIAGYYNEAAARAGCDPSFALHSSYPEYRRSLKEKGLDLSADLVAAIDMIGPLDVWHLQLFCDLVAPRDQVEPGLVFLTYEFDTETFVTSFVGGNPLPPAIHDGPIERATMISAGSAIDLIEQRLSAVASRRP